LQSGDFCWQEHNEGVFITGCEKNVGFICVPDNINGKKVIGIGSEAFRNRKSITGVKLPDTVKSIGDYAFCNCRLLKSAELGEGIREAGGHVFYDARGLESITLSGKMEFIGDGFVKNCEALENITLITDGALSSQTVLFLNDISRRFYLILKKQQAMLLFPDFGYEYISNAPSMRFTTVTHGSGVEYRKAIEKGGINFEAYDNAFIMGKIEERRQTLIEIAVVRIMYPFELGEKSRIDYASYISENIAETIGFAAKKDGVDMLEVLDKNGVFDKDNIKEAIAASTDIKRADLSAYLMDIKHKRFGSEKRLFEL